MSNGIKNLISFIHTELDMRFISSPWHFFLPLNEAISLSSGQGSIMMFAAYWPKFEWCLATFSEIYALYKLQVQLGSIKRLQLLGRLETEAGTIAAALVFVVLNSIFMLGVILHAWTLYLHAKSFLRIRESECSSLAAAPFAKYLCSLRRQKTCQDGGMRTNLDWGGKWHNVQRNRRI